MPQQKRLGAPVNLWIGFLAAANLLVAFPQIDLTWANLFYRPGVGFPAHGSAWERLFYHSVPVLMVAVNLGLVLLWWSNQRTGRCRLGLDGRRLAVLLGLLILVPGLLVNGLLKEHWGRARPADVVEFGGARQFTPAFIPSDQGGRSFSSGHVAAAGYLIIVALALTGARSRWLAAALVYTALVVWSRMAAGAHFLSDALTSLFLVLLGAEALRRLLEPDRNW
ncbi:MAG: phosphatase PAP2 family protein [Chromatiaceae bacterium]|nr:MAG: phosphatase PAP2 family protein [Chromatiaceae bacterium]